MAALAFTFPVVLVLNSLNLGIGIGASAVISKAVGENNHEKVTQLSSASLTLGVVIAILAIIIGELTIQPLFRFLGANDSTLTYITDYMRIWYAGVPFVVIPMIGNNIIRALGDTKTPSIVMMIAAGVNIILDPLLIFGIGIFPKMGVSGAAIATVLARFTTFSVSLYILIIREKVVSLKIIHWKSLFASWKIILFIGMPNAIARMIMPVGSGIITRLLSGIGVSAVAGYGIATRIEFFALAIIHALASVIPVFVGQNFGAKKMDRIKDSLKISVRFSVVSGLIIYGILIVLAPLIARLFTSSKDVIDIVVLYLRIVPLGYAFQGILLIINGALNALQKPIKATFFNLLQMLVLYVPLAILTSKYFGIYGIFTSLVISYFIASMIAHKVMYKEIESQRQ